MGEKFKVYESEIPDKITVNLGAMDKCLFARMLTDFGFGAEVAGDTFEHLLKKGLKKVYNEYHPEDKIY